MEEPKRFWFPAKRYGWGWGFPVTWQGWLVLAGFLVMLEGGILIFPPHVRMAWFLGYTVVLSLALVGICFLKGEPPSWRWGKK